MMGGIDKRNIVTRDRDGTVVPGELRVLALDGGGVRGALISGYLEAVEKKLQQAGKRSILDSVDLIAGTSTGAIVGSLMAVGFSAASVSQFYLKNGKYVFEPPYKQFNKWLGFLVACGIAAVLIRLIVITVIWIWNACTTDQDLLVPKTLTYITGVNADYLAFVGKILWSEFWLLFGGGVLAALLLQVIAMAWLKGFPLYQVLFAKYGLRDLEVELAKALDTEAEAGNLKLSPNTPPNTSPADLPVDAASCRLAIVTYDLAADEAIVVKSDHLGRTSRKIKTGWKLIDAIRCSTAAPFYFPPKRIAAAVMGRVSVNCDGGVWATNPGLVGYVEAHKILHDRAARRLEPLKLKVLSIGTGIAQPRPYKNPFIGFGLFWWAAPFLGTLWNGQSMNVHYMLEKLMPTEDYVRINFAIDKKLGALDNVANFPALIKAGANQAVITQTPCIQPSPSANQDAVDAGFDWLALD